MTVTIRVYVCNFSKQLRKAYRGDISSLVKSEPLPSPTYRLVSVNKIASCLPVEATIIVCFFPLFFSGCNNEVHGVCYFTPHFL